MASRAHVSTPEGVACTFAALSLVFGCSGDGSGNGRKDTGVREPSAEAWPEADALFRRDARWRGADGAFSVDLGGGRVAWLFGDTFVTTSSAHVREESEMVRNTVGLMTGSDPTTATMTFHWRTDADGTPASFFPEHGAFWFWPGDGERLGPAGPLLVFLLRIRHDPSGDPGFDFEGVGWEAVRIPNPDADPEAWTLERLRVPPNPWNIAVGDVTALARDGWLA